MVIFRSSAQSVYFNDYFCLTCIYQLFLIVDHTKSYVEKNTLKIRVTNAVPRSPLFAVLILPKPYHFGVS